VSIIEELELIRRFVANGDRIAAIKELNELIKTVMILKEVIDDTRK